MPKFVEGFADKIVVPPGARDALVFDSEVRGFGIRKYADGKSFYIVKFSHQGKQRRQSLGEVTRGNLRAMRLLASDAKAQARQGRDILAERAAAREAVKNRRMLGSLVSEYLEARKGELRPRSYSEVSRYMRVAWRPLHDRDIKSITRADVMAILDTLERNPRAADAARGALCRFFSWAIDHRDRYVDANPLAGVKARSTGGSRERVLSDGELREVWHATEDDDHGRITRLLILTGQRRHEIGDLSWDEIDAAGRQICLPRERCKNDRAHSIPLSDQALALLPERRDGHGHLFGRLPGAGFSGWSRGKRELDARIAVARKAAGVKTSMPDWCLHDLRRTACSGWQRLGIRLEVGEAILNHQSGTRSGVAGTYRRYEYDAEKREALELWSAHVLGIVR